MEKRDQDVPATAGASPLKPYMAFDGENGSSEGAALVFARTVTEAKAVAFPVLSGWGCDFLDMRVRHIEDGAHLFADGNQEKLAAGIPHVIETPKSCERCELWGEVIYEDGICDTCKGDTSQDDDEEIQAEGPAKPEQSNTGNTEVNPQRANGGQG